VPDSVTELDRQIEAAAADPHLTPRERMLKIRVLRERCMDLVGRADKHLNLLGRMQEAQVAADARDELRVGDQAVLREALLERLDDPELVERVALLSAQEIEQLEEEGLLEEAITQALRHPFDAAKHPHGAHGEFERTYHEGERPAGKVDAQGNPIDERYRDYFKDDPGATIAHVSRLKPTRQDTPEHIAKARRNLDRAKRGLILKRKPLSVVENGDGSLSVIDGNSTLAALQQEGLTHLPVKVDETQTDAGSAAVDRVADEVADRSERAERDVTPAVRNVVESAGGRMDGLEYRLKTRESIKSKIRRKQEKYPGLPANRAGEKVLDGLRYTAVLPDEGYVQGIHDTLDKLGAVGFHAQETKNFWGQGDDYDGFHAILRGPDSAAVELQFHTEGSLGAKNKLHGLFAQFRDSHDSKERYQLWQKMRAITGAVPEPPGVEGLGPRRHSPSAEQAHRRHESFAYQDEQS
jgi:hypothetical protein